MISAEILEALVRMQRPHFSLAHILMRAGAKSESTRCAFLRFVDSISELSSAREIGEHLGMYMGAVQSELPWFMRCMLSLMHVPFGTTFAGLAARFFVQYIMAPHFVVPDTAHLARTADVFASDGAGIVVDLLGEQVLSWHEADEYMARYIALMHNHSLAQVRSEHILHVALKFSSLYPFFSPHNWDESVRQVGDRFARLLREAQKTNTHITVDAEHWQVCGLAEEIFLETVMRDEFRGYPHVGIALQAYRKDAALSARRFAQAARTRGIPFTIRLIKGAYWDTELATAQQNGWPMPLFERKEDTDAQYLALARYLLRKRRYVHSVFGTHNPTSISTVFGMARELGMESMPEIQVLYGLGEQVRKALCLRGIPVRVYMPVGDLRQGMAYLARRILENTANDGVILRLIS